MLVLPPHPRCHLHPNAHPTCTHSKGYNDGADIAHELIPQIAEWGAAAVTLHGRTRQQRYSRAADWDYIQQCARAAGAAGLPLVGNGDVMSYQDWEAHMGVGSGVATCMIGRGALIKPWVFTGGRGFLRLRLGPGHSTMSLSKL